MGVVRRRVRLTLDNNPSPGNKAGGLTTIYEKSLGAVAKGGSTALGGRVSVRRANHGQGARRHGHSGLGPCERHRHRRRRGQCDRLHDRPRQLLRLQAVSFAEDCDEHAAVQRLPDDMDLDAGPILAGRAAAEIGQEIFAEILSVASGKKTKSEKLGLGTKNMSPG